MNEIIEKDIINIEELVYKINGIEVMLDSDLAKLYNVETKRIKEAVKNNPEKFPNRYLFRITNEEYNSLKSKFSTSKGGSRKGHTAFTEQGIYMLATVIKSKNAIQVSIKIMDTFVKMRHYINFNMNLLPNRVMLLEEKVDSNSKKIEKLFNKFNPNDITKNCIFFEGAFYDSYSMLLDIFNESLEEIIIIDNYAGKDLLDIIKEVNKRFIIISKNINEKLKIKYKKQYHNVTFIDNNSFHDRFIIIDRYTLYLCGSSFKDLGRKCFGIHKFDDKIYLQKILEVIDIKK